MDKGQEMVRVDKYLFDRLTSTSRNRIQKAAGCRICDGERQTGENGYKVKPLDVITVMMDRPAMKTRLFPKIFPG